MNLKRTWKYTALTLGMLSMLVACSTGSQTQSPKTGSSETAGTTASQSEASSGSQAAASGEASKSEGSNAGDQQPNESEASVEKLPKTMNLNDAYRMAHEDKTVFLIDVRTKAEYDEGHVPGALLIPLNQIEQEIEKTAADKDAKIILYCRSGNRSGQAQAALERMGYTNVSNAGGVGSFDGTLAR